MPQCGSQLEWVRPPQQARSQATLERLLDAAEAALSEKSWQDCTVSEMARRAGSSVGAFYSRFSDKDGLLNSLQERFLREAFATADAALDPQRWEGASLREIMGEVVRFLVEITRTREGVLRAGHLRAGVDMEFRARSVRLMRHLADGLRHLVQQRSSELRTDDPALASDFSLQLVLSVLNYRLVMGEDAISARHLSDQKLSEQLAQACLSYMGVEPATS